MTRRRGGRFESEEEGKEEWAQNEASAETPPSRKRRNFVIFLLCNIHKNDV